MLYFDLPARLSLSLCVLQHKSSVRMFDCRMGAAPTSLVLPRYLTRDSQAGSHTTCYCCGMAAWNNHIKRRGILDLRGIKFHVHMLVKQYRYAGSTTRPFFLS